MKQIIITLESPEFVALEKEGNKDAVAKVNSHISLNLIGSKLL